MGEAMELDVCEWWKAANTSLLSCMVLRVVVEWHENLDS